MAMELVVGKVEQLVAVIVAGLSLLILWAASKRRASRFPRGPPAWPIIGHLPLLRARPHQVLADLCIKQGYGPIMGLRLGARRAVVVSDAAMAKELLHTHDKAFANRVPYLFTNSLFYGYDTAVAMSPSSPRWAALRKMCTQELLSAQRMNDLCHVRYEELRHTLHRLRAHASSTRDSSHTVPIDMGAFLADMVASSFGRMMCSKNLAELGPEFPHLLKAIANMMFPVLGDFLPWLKFMDAFPKRRMKHLHNRIDRIFDSIIHERRQLMAQCPPHQDLPNDILQVIISKWSSEENEFITINGIKAVMLDMFLGGIDTLSSTLEWALAELLRNPKCLHKLQNEVGLLSKEKKDIVMDEDVQQMPYLENVVKEVLRLHPFGPLLGPRVSSIECNIGNYTLPKGTQAFVNVWAIARDPLIWDKPENFYPERFERRDLDMRGQHYELLPFGAGRRMCLGMRLGISIVKVTLANLIKFFEWDLPDGQSPSSIDMTENCSLVTTKALPMLAIPKIRHELL